MINLITLFSSKISLFAAYAGDAACNHSNFLGLIPWYHYLPPGDFDGCTIKDFNFLPPGGQSDIPLILLAVVDDLLRIAGVVAVAFVVIGAFKYVASQGDPEGTAKAQSTIINALLGTAIAIAATLFVDFLGRQLGG